MFNNKSIINKDVNNFVLQNITYNDMIIIDNIFLLYFINLKLYKNPFIFLYFITL